MRGFIAFILLIVLIIVVLFISWSRVPEMVANNLSKKLQVPVSIGDMQLSPKSIKVSNLQIGNASGYKTLPKAFSAESLTIHAPLSSYMNQDIVIEEVTIDNIYLGLEFDSISGTNGNWTTIMSYYQRATEEEKQAGNRKTILIKKLVFTNISPYLVFVKEGKGIKKLPKIDRIELYNVSSEGGFPSDQLLKSVLGQMLKSVFEKEHLQNMLYNLLKDPQKTIETLTKPFKGLFQVVPKNDRRDALSA